MGVFDRQIATAQRLIAKYGQDCHWQKPAPEVEAEPGYPTAGEMPDPIPVRMAFFAPRDLGRGTEEFMAMMAGMDVSSSHEIGVLAGGLSFEPDDEDHIIRDPDGTPVFVSVQKIDKLAPNGQAILYFVSVTG